MELAIQFELLAQGPNFEEWGDVLVIVIMAILWLAGALAKVLTSRKGTQQQRQQEGPAGQATRKRETWQERLARKAQEMQQAAEAQGRQLEQAARVRTQAAEPRPVRATSQSSPPAGRVAVRTDQKGDSLLVYERPTDARQQPAKSPSSELRAGTGDSAYEPLGMREPPTPLEPAGARARAARQPAEDFLPDLILDYSDPDALRKAILHYEILGKPLALREPADETISF